MIQRRIGRKGRGGWRQRLAVIAALAVTGGGIVAPTLVSPADAALNDDKDTIAVLFSYPWNDIAEQCETTLGSGWIRVRSNIPSSGTHPRVPVVDLLPASFLRFKLTSWY